MKTIIEMARKAGAVDITCNGWTSWVGTQSPEFLERFAEIVTEQANARANTSWALMCKKMVEFEREAILELVDSHAKNNTDLVAAIRARGNT